MKSYSEKSKQIVPKYNWKQNRAKLYTHIHDRLLSCKAPICAKPDEKDRHNEHTAPTVNPMRNTSIIRDIEVVMCIILVL